MEANKKDVTNERTAKLGLWERKLLDFSLRNNLLNLRYGKRCMKLTATSLTALAGGLQGKGLTLSPAGTTADVVTELTESELATALKSLHRAARTAMEENGANSLYVATGLLRWQEEGQTETWRYAPLLLLPVDLVRKQGSTYVLRLRDEDAMLNTTLTELMRRQYDVDFSALATLPLTEEGTTYVMAVVKEAARVVGEQHSDWNVEECAALGLFSFSKFVMWNDLHSGGERMLQNPIVRRLAQSGIRTADVPDGAAFTPTEMPETDARIADKQCEPKAFAVPLDVDSSQLEAVIESGAGGSFILHGPPGTGKSQTITNMIANALYNGKRVLFVAEKMAALSVVQKRLEKIGLGPFCLEIHSNKATKTHLLAQFERTLEVAHRSDSNTFAEHSRQLFEQRQRLIAYMDALHTRNTQGFSVYDCIDGWLNLAGEELHISDALFTTCDTQRLAHIDTLLEEADAAMRPIGHPADHPLRQLCITDTSVTAPDRLRPHIVELQRAAQWFIDHNYAHLTVAMLHTLAALHGRAGQCREEATENCSTAILDENGTALQTEWKRINAQWFIPRFFSRRHLLKRLRKLGYQGNWQGVGTLAARLMAYAEADEHFRRQLAANDLTAQHMDAVANLVQHATALHLTDEGIAMTDVTAAAATWLQHLDKVHAWSLWCVKAVELQQDGLAEAVAHLIDHHTTGQDTARAIRKNVMRRQALLGIDANPQLQTFNGQTFEQLIEKYRALAKQFQQLTKEELYYKLAARIPTLTIDAANSSEMGILKRSIKSKARGMTIRSLIDHIPTLLPRLCPCMLMSPLSVAQYLDLDSEMFDLVIFDEASQMPTSEAIGAIARGKALVVVGDPMQMPPTSFFTTTNVDDDEAEIDDMESILDDCITLSMPSRYLTWHYRSQHESLIAFSNSQYYGGRLFTFPSVDDRVSKVQFVHVEGVYDMGKTRSNRTEADAIVDEVVRRLSDPELRQRSIGIVSFSKVQQSLIEDVLVSRLAERPDLEPFAYEGEEPIFIKNLENVQGDERDVILFSVGYGPDKDGKVSMNFGPLNNTGGERRLNVAVSRARYEMVVYSSMRPEQIDLNRTQAEGVKGLKKFLEFAISGRNVSPSTATSASTATESLPDAIATALEQRGYTVDKGIGRSRFKIDIAVVNPSDPDTYSLGILCDGTTYFETKTERDREIVQPSVLSTLGWHIMRVWSVDWFLNRDEVIQRIIRHLQPTDDCVADTAETPDAPAPHIAPQPSTSPQPATDAASASPVRTYQSATLKAAKGGIAAIETNVKRVHNQLQSIIKAEQPITFSLLCKRIATLWGATQSQKLQNILRKQLRDFYVDPMADDDNPCYWLDCDASLNYNTYRTNSQRDIADIPLIELMNAMRYAVEQQIAIPTDDLLRQTTRMLGFSRITDRIAAQLRQALDRLQRTHALTIDGDIVKVAE